MRVDPKKLRIAMARKQMNNTDLAKAANVTAGTVLNVLGHRKSCTLATLGKIAQALGVDVTEIIED